MKTQSPARRASLKVQQCLVDVGSFTQTRTFQQCLFVFHVFPESFIEVSENEDDQLVMMKKESSDNVDEEKGTVVEEESSEESVTEASSGLKIQEEQTPEMQTEETEQKDGTQSESSLAPAVNEWEHFDVVSPVDDLFCV